MIKNTVATQIAKQRSILYRKYVNGSYAKYNKERIDFVLKRVYKKQISSYNKCEEKVFVRLIKKGLTPQSQKIIPIIKDGGKIDHLYIADFVVGNTIIEVDGPQHKESYDNKRDKLTSDLGYNTIRIPTSDLSDETIDSYINELI